MNVLVACEMSGRVRDAFIARGHTAISCDLLPTEVEGPHYQGDIRDLDLTQFDLMIAHPPCTHLASSGARWFKDKVVEQQAALEFVLWLAAAPIEKIAIENPVGVLSSKWRKPDQIIQPWQFGDEATKTTCLWTKNLPALVPTNVVDKGEQVRLQNGKNMARWYYESFKLPAKERAIVRSRTFEGIAKAMAEQWG